MTPSRVRSNMIMATHLYHVVFWSMLINLVVIYSDIIAKHFTEQPLYTDVFLKVNISKEYTADSFFACALLCGPTCSCVGYLEASKRCRVFDSCNTTDTVNEDGWIYYTTPSGQWKHLLRFWIKKIIKSWLKKNLL